MMVALCIVPLLAMNSISGPSLALVFTTWLLIGMLVASLASTGVSVYSQVSSANRAEDQARAQRAYHRQLAEAENRRFAILKKQAKGRARARYAKGGVLPETGTPVEVLGLQALELERQRRLAEWSIMARGSAAEFSAQSAAARLRMGAVSSGFAGLAQAAQTGSMMFGPDAPQQVEFAPLDMELGGLPGQEPPRILGNQAAGFD